VFGTSFGRSSPPTRSPIVPISPVDQPAPYSAAATR